MRTPLKLPRRVEAFAPAKINLTLHVTGRRPDGYHDIDSLVVFAAIGDRLTASVATQTGLNLVGPQASGLSGGPDNLVLRAASLFVPPIHADLTLEKNLPVASGIGGGSADAAACLRALSVLSGRDIPSSAQVLSLGADVPVCLSDHPMRMRGTGERLDPVPALPPMSILLVNPGMEVSTPAVFRTLSTPDNRPMAQTLPVWADADGLSDWLAHQRNDLQPPALSLVPAIKDVLEALSRSPGCGLARMSGSGATCFGLFKDASAAKDAERVIAAAHPSWWCAAAPVLGGTRSDGQPRNLPNP